jgi:hypothetical protein
MIKTKLMLFVFLVLPLALTVPKMSFALDDAYVPPKGCILLKLVPKVSAASNWFDNDAMARGLNEISKLTHVNTQLEMYYSFTDSIMTGLKFPIDYIREGYKDETKIDTTAMLNPWFALQHEFLTKPFDCAYAISVKLPIVEIKPIGIIVDDPSKNTVEDFFYIDDKQIDIYPVFYLDWQSSLGIYIYSKIGYKYRMENDLTKPRNELKFAIETGYAIIPDVIRIFTCSDYTRFYKGEFDGNPLKAGYLYSIKAGVRFMLGRNFRAEIITRVDPWGKNQFQWVGGNIGIAYVSGDY